MFHFLGNGIKMYMGSPNVKVKSDLSILPLKLEYV